jgi:osmotically-inducible protein OsmY
MQMLKKFYKLFIFLFAALTLQGCVNAAITSASVVYDRKNIQRSLSDHNISIQAYRKIYKDTKKYKNTSVAISSFHRIVLMTGQIPDPAERTEIENIVKSIPDIEHVYNLTTISEPVSTLISMSDSWITTKIKTRLLAENDFDQDSVKVITENGTVYLMGILPPEQADIAVDVARTTVGVQNVVKIFSYLRISKT